MKIQVLKLRNALGLLEGLATVKSARTKATAKSGKGGRKSTKTTFKPQIYPVLSNVLLQDGMAIATDLEIGVTVALDEVVGQYLLPYREVSKLLRYVPGNEEVEIAMMGHSLSLSWEGGSANYQADDPAEYPVLPQINPVIKCAVSADILTPALVSMLDYCSDEQERPVLTGVSLFLGTQLELAAGDGNRMAYKTLPISIPPADGLKTVILPQRVVKTMELLWKKAPRPIPEDTSVIDIASMVATKGPMELELSPILIRVQFGIVTLLAKTITGTPPNFKQLIPSSGSSQFNSVNIYAADLEIALRRIMGAVEVGEAAAVRMEWDNGKMKLATGYLENRIEVSMPVGTSNGAGRVALDFKYLMEYIKGKAGLITMDVSTQTNPVLFRHSNSPLVCIMPMNVSWPGDPVAETKAETVQETTAAQKSEETNAEEPEDETAEDEDKSAEGEGAAA
ncbi:MAG TPA: hypothetical protein VMW64_00980 [Dehalococcoidia bacterium]|nr:hypothetical protein [Dehalococcoidia bacterium]